MDTSDLQDNEIIYIRRLAHDLTQKWGRKPNNQRNLEEMCREATHEARQHGIIIDWDLTNVILGGYPVLVVIGKDDAHEEKYGFDHERKRHDVLKAKGTNTEREVLGK